MGKLKITQKLGEKFFLQHDFFGRIIVRVIMIKKNKVMYEITAPKEIVIIRENANLKERRAVNGNC